MPKITADPLEKIVAQLGELRAAVANLERRERPRAPIPQLGAVGLYTAMVLSLYNLRFFVGFSRQAANGTWLDWAGSGNTLTPTGSPTYGLYNLSPYTILNGSSQYHTAADSTSLSITGALTVGVWVNPTTVTGTKTILEKNGSYRLRLTAGVPSFTVTGASGSATATSTVTLAAGEWAFLWGGYNPAGSVEIGVGVGSAVTWILNSTAVPASLTDSAGALDLGRSASGANE